MPNVLPLLIKEYGARLKDAGVPKPHQEANKILRLILGKRTELDIKHKEAIDGAFNLRERRMPIERIFGSTEFCGLKLRTELDVFKPYPETEDVIYYAVEMLKDENRPLRILDLGTGTGCILLAILHALPQATGIGIDISERAIAVAKENARTTGLDERAEFGIGNWSQGTNEKFDLIISNPPRVPTSDIPLLLPEMRDYDPPHSLDGGKDGMDFVRKLAVDFDRLSNDKAICVCQIGPSHAKEAESIFRRASFGNTEIKGNYADLPCCIVVKKGYKATSAPMEGIDMLGFMSSWFKAFT
ncbi:MAG: HemK/PrmC family methyltransferase [Bdellovibrionales bacterium]